MKVPFPAGAQSRLTRSRTVLVHTPPAFGGVALMSQWLAQHSRPTVHLDASVLAPGELRELFDDDPAQAGVLIERADLLDDSLLADLAGRGPTMIAVDERSHRVRRIPGVELLVARDLVLSADDLARGTDGALDAASAARVRELTGGWPASAALALDVVGRADDAVALTDDLVGHEVRRTMVETVAPWLSSQWLPVLRYAATAGGIAHGELAGAGLPTDAVVTLLELALLTPADVAGEPLLVLHRELADHLVEDLGRTRPGDLDELRRLVAQTRHRLRIGDSGLSAAVEARDWELTRDILDDRATALAFTAHRPRAHSVLRALPRELVSERPRLAHRAELYGLMPLGTTATPPPLTPEQAHEAYRTGKAAEILEATIMAMSARRYRGRLREARDLALQGTQLADLAISAQSSTAPVVPFWYLQAGLTCSLAGHAREAQDLFRRGWQTRDWDDYGFVPRGLAVHQAVLTAFRGEHVWTATWVREAESRPAHGSWVDGATGTGLRVATALMAADMLRPASVDVSDLYSSAEIWPFVCWAQAQLLLRDGKGAAVLDLVDDMTRIHPATRDSDGIHPALFATLRAQARLSLGQGTRARVALEAVPPTFSPAVPVRVAIDLLAGRPAQARAVAMEHRGRTHVSARVQAELGLLSAAAAAELGEETSARAGVAQALALIVEHGLWSALLVLPPERLGRLAALDAELAAERWRLAPVTSLYPDHIRRIELTKRELLVLEGLTRGLTPDQLAADLYVSRNTVKSQLRSLYAKLHVHSREEAVARAAELALVPRQPGS